VSSLRGSLSYSGRVNVRCYITSVAAPTLRLILRAPTTYSKHQIWRDPNAFGNDLISRTRHTRDRDHIQHQQHNSSCNYARTPLRMFGCSSRWWARRLRSTRHSRLSLPGEQTRRSASRMDHIPRRNCSCRGNSDGTDPRVQILAISPATLAWLWPVAENPFSPMEPWSRVSSNALQPLATCAPSRQRTYAPGPQSSGKQRSSGDSDSIYEYSTHLLPMQSCHACPEPVSLSHQEMYSCPDSSHING
jgi:hypothetical protein